MPVRDGVSPTRRIVEEHPDVEVLVLTSFSDRQRVMEALDAGAGGYVLKDTEPADLLAAIRSTARGHSPSTPGWPAPCCTRGGARPGRRSSPTASRRCPCWSAVGWPTSLSPAA